MEHSSDFLPMLLLVAFEGFVGWLVWNGLKAGQFVIAGRAIERSVRPFSYWALCAFLIFMGVTSIWRPWEQVS